MNHLPRTVPPLPPIEGPTVSTPELQPFLSQFQEACWEQEYGSPQQALALWSHLYEATKAPRIAYYYASYLLDTGNDATELIKSALATEPDCYHLWLLHNRTLEPSEALPYLQGLATACNESPAVIYELALAYYKLQHFTQAEDYLRLTLRLRSKYFAAQVLLAKCQIALQNDEAAYQTCLQAKQNHYDDALQMLISKTAFATNRIEEGIQAAEDGFSVSPNQTTRILSVIEFADPITALHWAERLIHSPEPHKPLFVPKIYQILTKLGDTPSLEASEITKILRTHPSAPLYAR